MIYLAPLGMIYGCAYNIFAAQTWYNIRSFICRRHISSHAVRYHTTGISSVLSRNGYHWKEQVSFETCSFHGIYYAFWYNATLMCGALHSFYRFSIYRSILVQPILFSTQGNGCTTKTPPPENGNSRYRVVFIYTRRSPQGNSPYCGNQFLLSKNHPPSGVLLLRCLFA